MSDVYNRRGKFECLPVCSGDGENKQTPISLQKTFQWVSVEHTFMAAGVEKDLMSCRKVCNLLNIDTIIKRQMFDFVRLLLLFSEGGSASSFCAETPSRSAYYSRPSGRLC